MKDKISRSFAKQISSKTFVQSYPETFKNILDLLNNVQCLQLDMDIPFDLIANEIQAIPDNFFVAHRDTYESNAGWKSFVLHGKSYDATRETEYYTDNRPLVWTQEAETYCPDTVKFFKHSWPSTDFERVRVMLLEPHSIINLHNDPGSPDEFWPVNIAITQPSDCNFYLDKFGIVPFTPGSAFLINVGNMHTVINDSDQKRYHIIVHHKKTNKKFDKIIERSYNKLYASKVTN
jgi:hypothetical protein